jgi:hypothetical protein
MAKVKESVNIYFGGINIKLIKGNEVQDESPLVQAKPELFEIKEYKPKVVKKTKVEKKVEEPKEELLVEEPVAELKVTEIEEPVQKEKTKRKKK